MKHEPVHNLRMKELLKDREALDVSAFLQPDGDYHLPKGFFQEDIDYCDAKREAWIWSIGKDLKTGEVVAATSAKFYMNPAYECLWLR